MNHVFIMNATEFKKKNIAKTLSKRIVLAVIRTLTYIDLLTDLIQVDLKTMNIFYIYYLKTYFNEVCKCNVT